jgi:hypothetical protein
MARPQIRQGQLITTFGPGAMTDLPERSVLIAGLDAWVGERRQIQEPRLSRKVAELLGAPAIRLECPPEDQDGAGFVRSYVFPLWFVTQSLVPGRPPGWRSRRLVQWSSLEDKGRKFCHFLSPAAVASARTAFQSSSAAAVFPFKSILPSSASACIFS